MAATENPAFILHRVGRTRNETEYVLHRFVSFTSDGERAMVEERGGNTSTRRNTVVPCASSVFLFNGAPLRMSQRNARANGIQELKIEVV